MENTEFGSFDYEGIDFDEDEAEFFKDNFSGLSQSSSLNDENTSSLAVDEPHPLWNSFDYGQNHADWISFTAGLKSGGIYNKVVNDFLAWQLEIKNSTTLLERLKLYFETLRDEKKENGSRKYAPNKFRPMASMFFSFWLYSGEW
jgi:hypothetical protein